MIAKKEKKRGQHPCFSPLAICMLVENIYMDSNK